MLSVSDTGHGMSEDVQARIFEPFFTTKAAGSGTGLGLAMVYGAVEQNGGSIEVASAPGRGSTFRIRLPETRGPKAPRQAPEADLPRGTETVLLVEDEAAVREVTREQLESLGYRVLACANAAEALRRRRAARRAAAPAAHRRRDAGHERPRARRAPAQSRPGLRVLFTSGYGEDVIARHGVLEPGRAAAPEAVRAAEARRPVRTALAA